MNKVFFRSIIGILISNCIFSNLVAQTATDLQVQDSRYISTTPSTYEKKFQVSLKYYSAIGLPQLGTNYSTVIGLRGWSSDNTGGKAHELAFSDDGQIRLRSGNSPSWGSWMKLISEDENGNVAIGNLANTSKLQIVGNELGNSINDRSNLLMLRAKLGYNESKLQIFNKRFTSGDTWLTISTRIQQTIDVSDMAYIEFNPPGMSWGMALGTADQGRLYIDNKGNVGIGTQKIADPAFGLFVEKGIRTRKVKVDAVNWPDYVFDSCYNLNSLKWVSEYVRKNKHLPDVPSAQQLSREGVDLMEMQETLLRKIEELTLYIIELNEKLEAQEKLIKLKRKE